MTIIKNTGKFLLDILHVPILEILNQPASVSGPALACDK
jgi:hypothetical protein